MFSAIYLPFSLAFSYTTDALGVVEATITGAFLIGASQLRTKTSRKEEWRKKKKNEWAENERTNERKKKCEKTKTKIEG